MTLASRYLVLGFILLVSAFRQNAASPEQKPEAQKAGDFSV